MTLTIIESPFPLFSKVYEIVSGVPSKLKLIFVQTKTNIYNFMTLPNNVIVLETKPKKTAKKSLLFRSVCEFAACSNSQLSSQLHILLSAMSERYHTYVSCLDPVKRVANLTLLLLLPPSNTPSYMQPREGNESSEVQVNPKCICKDIPWVRGQLSNIPYLLSSGFSPENSS